MNTPTLATGEIRLNFTIRHPEIADAYEGLGVSLGQAEAVLCLIVQAYESELPRQCGKSVAALEKLFVSVVATHAGFCKAVVSSRLGVDALLESRCVLAQLRAVLALLLDSLMESEPAPDKVFSGLCAVQSLTRLFKAELAQARAVLARPSRQAASKASLHQGRRQPPAKAGPRRPARLALCLSPWPQSTKGGPLETSAAARPGHAGGSRKRKQHDEI